MTVFSNCTIPKHQGNIGEARAIYEYTRLGFIVSKPLIECCPYDLLIDMNGTIQRVSVKTSRQKVKSVFDAKGYNVQLYTSGGNTKSIIRKDANNTAYDILFVLIEDGRCWSIPSVLLGDRKNLLLGSTKEQFQQYEIGAS